MLIHHLFPSEWRPRASFGLILAGLGPAIASPAAGQGMPVFVREVEGIPLFDALGPVPNAWLGGWQQARPQLLDVDADGDLDLFVAEDDGQLRFYRNGGSASVADFVFETDDYAGVHEFYFTRFHDLDGDGDFDLLVEAPPFVTDVGGNLVERPGAFVYTNTGTPAAPSYENLSPHPGGYLADEAGEPIPLVTTSPDFVDLEGDGDPDLLFGDPGGFVWLYRNVGTPEVASFRKETESYQDILIVFGACSGERLRPLSRTGPDLRHGFMLFSFFDFDGDTLPDLFVGDQFNPNVYHYANLGGSPNPSFSCRTERFYPDSTGTPGIFAAQFLVSAFGDLDDDGDPDAILGSGSSGTDALWFYRNEAGLRWVTRDYLPEFDRGRESVPVLADVDGDGLLDLLVGSTSEQEISLFGNIGAPDDPRFALFREDWISLPNSAWAGLELADVDGDGDLDVFAGTAVGGVRFWRNQAGPGEPVEPVEVLDDPDFGEAFGKTFRNHVDTQALPRFFDEDGDGDLDVLMGNWDFGGEARLMFFRNDGDATRHEYVLASSDYQGLGTLGQSLAPVFGDLDADGDDDLLIGRSDGTIVLLRNRGRPGAPVFEREGGNFGEIDVGVTAIPVLADVDGDSDLDLFVGEGAGGLNFYRNTGLCAGPSAFALLSPADGAEVERNGAVTFDWEPSFDAVRAEATYELRIATDPADWASQWKTFSDLQESTVSIVPREIGLRLAKSFYWTVVAEGTCGATPSEWRVATLADFPAHSAPFSGDRPAILATTPSPTSGATTIRWGLPAEAIVRLAIYDVNGRRVARLLEGPAASGIHTTRWHGRTDSATPAASGIYFVRIEADGKRDVRRLALIR